MCHFSTVFFDGSFFSASKSWVPVVKTEPFLVRLGTSVSKRYSTLNGECIITGASRFAGLAPFASTMWRCRMVSGSDFTQAEKPVKGMYPAPDIHEHFTIHKWLRQTAYIFTHNFNNLEHIANNCMSAMTHTDVTTAHH